MAEIKSTLDLVLEKTRDMTLSSDEKQQQQREEIETRLRGMLQKYIDGSLTREQLADDYAALKNKDGHAAVQALANEVIGRLELEHDNASLLEVLELLEGWNVTIIGKVIDELRGKYRNAARQRSEQLKKALAHEHFITGPAVVPNLTADAQWQRKQHELLAEFQAQLHQAAHKFFDSGS